MSYHLNMNNDLKQLTGSEKQIQWASAIRGQLIRCLDEWIARVKEVPAEKTTDEAKVAKIAEMESYKAFFATKDSDYFITGGKTLPREYDFTSARLRVASLLKAAGMIKQ